MDKFEQWFKDQDFYTNMRFVHGDALFDKDGDFFRILAVQIAWEAWQSRQAEVEEANAKSQMCRDEKTHAINRWSQIRKEVEEKDKRINELEKTEFALAKVKQILNKHIKTKLLESIIVRELIDLLFSNKG